MRRTVILIAAIAVLLAGLVGCGPEGPRDTGGPKADPVWLLGVLPTPDLMTDAGTARTADAAALLTAMTGGSDPAVAERVTSAGLERAAVRTWRHADGGTLTAAVSVWPSNPIASNFGLQVVQRLTGRSGYVVWTPVDVPGGQGVRQGSGDHERLLARTVGPNTLVVRATGAVPDAVVAVTMARMVRVQQGRDGASARRPPVRA